MRDGTVIETRLVLVRMTIQIATKGLCPHPLVLVTMRLHGIYGKLILVKWLSFFLINDP